MTYDICRAAREIVRTAVLDDMVEQPPSALCGGADPHNAEFHAARVAHPG